MRLHRVLLMLALSVMASAQGIIITIAGADFPFTGNGKLATGNPLGAVTDVAADSQGNVYFTDPVDHLVLKVDADGVLHVIAGNGVPGYSGDGGPATNASIAGPSAVAADPAGNVYFSEGFTHRIRKITRDGIISTFAGTGQ